MHRRDIWLINLEPAIGAEIKKTRPAVIVNDDAIGILPLRVILPITEWKDKFQIAPWMVKLEANRENGLNKNSAIDAFQIRSVSVSRFVQKIGFVSEETMQQLSQAVKLVLAM